jgi:hypothetical protein
MAHAYTDGCLVHTIYSRWRMLTLTNEQIVHSASCALHKSASHWRVAPENFGSQKEQKCNTFACHTCNEVRSVFWEFAERKLAKRKYKISRLTIRPGLARTVLVF